MTETKSVEANRPLPLEGTTNTRELGGYPTQNGGRTREHVFLRSDNLHHATPADEKWLHDYGVRTVVDLRTSVERLGHLDHDYREPMERDHVSMMQHIQAELVKDRIFGEEEKAPRTWADVYVIMTERLKPQFRHVLDILIQNEDCALFHCTAGRDRTGIVAMLLLTMAGVPEDVIITDYVATNDNMSPDLIKNEKIMEALGGDVIPEGAFEALPDTMLTLIGHMKKVYGSVVGYLKDIGITDADFDALRAKFVAAPET